MPTTTETEIPFQNALVSDWYSPNGQTFPSQYGHVTFGQWCQCEVKRARGALQIVAFPESDMIALARAE